MRNIEQTVPFKGQFTQFIGGNKIILVFCVEDVHFLLTINPPVGLVTRVVPMVMFSFTSCKLGTVVFSEKEQKKQEEKS